jgi:epoxyqueuosine reductase
MSLNHELKQYALTIGFDDLGIAKVDGSLPYVDHVAQAAKDGRFGPLDYLHRTLEARLDIKSFFPDAKSVVVVVKNYYTGDHPASDEIQPKIARYAWGQDYHQWFKKKLKHLSDFLLARENGRVWHFNDTGPFLERAWAHKAGLGFIGKSAMFIHRDLGTWTFIGGFATDIILPADQAYVGPDCGSCTRCLDACPTNAIIAPKTVDARKCISTWTIERTLHPDAIEMAPRDHAWVFGCDICQEVCPWNKFEKITDEPRFQPVAGRMVLNEETFRQDLRGSPLYRTKRVGLLTNFLRIQKTLTKQNQRFFP